MRAGSRSFRGTNDGSKEARGEGSFASARGANVMSKDALGKSENSREVTGLVLGSNYVKERLVDEHVLYLNGFDLLAGEKGGDTVF
ncbi:hypothetical protein ACOSP7_013234 [Xanthoceras sorbifolium]